MSPFPATEDLLRARSGLSVDEEVVFDAIAGDARGMDASVAMLDSLAQDFRQWHAVYAALDRLYAVGLAVESLDQLGGR